MSENEQGGDQDQKEKTQTLVNVSGLLSTALHWAILFPSFLSVFLLDLVLENNVVNELAFKDSDAEPRGTGAQTSTPSLSSSFLDRLAMTRTENFFSFFFFLCDDKEKEQQQAGRR